MADPAPLTLCQREALLAAARAGLRLGKAGFRPTGPRMARRVFTRSTVVTLGGRGLLEPDEAGVMRPTEAGFTAIGRDYIRRLSAWGRP